jgi:exopolyphosphatase/guanosine-5'-triphosphate,3'-diphosphate pyrophosphatase
MPVGIIDVGSNTVRLYVEHDGEEIRREKAMVRLGDAIERLGSVPEAKLDETAALIERFVSDAREEGASQVEVLVTSPGRQARNGAELLERIAAAAGGAPVRLLSAQEEGRLAFLGAIEGAGGPSRRRVAVCDVGGGSSQVAIGSRREGLAWIRSVDIGSMRLTSRLLEDDPPGDGAIARARVELERLLDGFSPPEADVALAVGGSARGLRAIVGSVLGADELDEVAGILARTPAYDITTLYGVEPARVRTLAAGAVILGALQQLLGLPLRVTRGGVREGAAIEIGRRAEAA